MSNTSTCWLSILIPVYNVEAYVQECLESVLVQMRPGIEIILLDDCSTDNSLGVLQTVIDGSHTNITVLRHEYNRGLSAARNTLLDNAQGDYVWFLDSDDALHPGSLLELQQITRHYWPDLILCDFRVWREQQRWKHLWRGENHTATFAGPQQQLLTNPLQLFKGIYQKRNLHIWSKISKRSLWADDLRFPEGRVMEDMVITPRLALRVQTYFYQPRVWVAYRQREGSILSSSNLQKIDDMSIACADVLRLWLTKYPQLSRQARFYFTYFCVKTHICVANDLRSLNNNSKPELTLYRTRFFNHIGCNKRQLVWEYLRRGWFLRLKRFLRDH